MAVLTGFTRPVQGDTNGNPIVAEDLRAWVALNTGLTITYVEIHPTSIDVTGTVVSGNTAVIQAAINSYVYAQLITSPFALVANMSNTYPMVDDSSKFVTEHAALAADTAVLSVANTKTANRTYVNGIAQNGTANTGDIVEWIVTLTTAGGTITDYVTTQGTTRTSSGTALLSTLFPDSVQTNFIDSTGVYAQGNPTITSNKTVSVPFAKQGFNGVTVLSINVLGSVAMNTIPDGVTVKVRLVGIAA